MSTTLSKPVKKEIVKNHLQGLDVDENLRKLATSGNRLDRETIQAAVDEFGTESEKRDLETVAKDYGVSRLASELAEVASFKRKNAVELADMLRGAKIARVLKNYGAGIPELEQFLSTVYSRASEKGYNAETIVAQISALNGLEKKHDLSFDELRAEYDKIGSEVKSRQREKGKVAEEIAQLTKHKSEVMAQNKIDEQELVEYVETKQKLLSLGFDANNLDNVKDFLLAIKAQKLDPVKVISKLNSIGELEKKLTTLEQQTSVANDELLWKKALLTELRKLQETNLSVEQVDSIQKIVVRISSERGIDPSKAYAQFEEDILRNYDPVLGLRPVVTSLQDSEKRLVAEGEKMKQHLAAEEAAHSDKVKRIEERYAKIAGEINAYNELKESGVDAGRILSWHEIIQTSKLDFTAVESQLKNYASLKSLEGELNKKIVASMSEAEALRKTVADLTQEKVNVEASIKSLSESAIAEVNSASSKILSSITSLGEKAQSSVAQLAVENEKTLDDFRSSYQQGIKKAVEESKEELKATFTQLNSSAGDFSLQLKKVVDEAVPQIKTVTMALEAGERLGKYRNILPLLELLDEKNVSEADALIAMWNVSNRFSLWVADHYRSSTKTAISDPLSKLVTSIDEEIQKINR